MPRYYSYRNFGIDSYGLPDIVDSSPIYHKTVIATDQASKPNKNDDVFVMPKISDLKVYESTLNCSFTHENRVFHLCQGGLYDRLKRFIPKYLVIRVHDNQTSMSTNLVITDIQLNHNVGIGFKILYPVDVADSHSFVDWADIEEYWDYDLSLGYHENE